MHQLACSYCTWLSWMVFHLIDLYAFHLLSLRSDDSDLRLIMHNSPNMQFHLHSISICNLNNFLVTYCQPLKFKPKKWKKKRKEKKNNLVSQAQPLCLVNQFGWTQLTRKKMELDCVVIKTLSAYYVGLVWGFIVTFCQPSNQKKGKRRGKKWKIILYLRLNLLVFWIK